MHLCAALDPEKKKKAQPSLCSLAESVQILSTRSWSYKKNYSLLMRPIIIGDPGPRKAAIRSENELLQTDPSSARPAGCGSGASLPLLCAR